MTKTHATGSAFTYGQRYLLKMIFNVATGEQDDDGQKAGGDGPLSDDQKQILVKLMEESGADYTKFLKYFGVESIADIPASKFADARGLLEKKKASK